MPPLAELPPITDERRLAVAQWVETNVRPVMHAAAEAKAAEGVPTQEFEVRDYQIDAWANLDIAREAERVRALGNLATGLGKTFVAAVDVMRYREWCAAQDPPMIPRILYVSHQHDINEQAAKTFSTVMPDAEIDFFKTKRENLVEADITFATIQSLYRELERFDPQDFEYIIWDESHHLEAETFKVVRDYFDPLFEHAITATIERMDKKDIQEYFGTPLYQKTLPEGIAEGHLVDVEYHIVFDKAIKEKLKEGFNPKTLEEIKELFKNKPPREAIARNIQEEVERLGLEDPKTIVFCDSIEEAEEMADLLGGVAYHSETKDRKKILQGFRAGQHRIITTRDMFNEGVDIPDAELIVFLRSTGSPTIFEQQLGRGLRRAPGKTKVTVLDFVANIERIARVRELAEQIRRARPVRDGDEGVDGLPIDDLPLSDEGLQIHTPHGDFDFDKIAIDLLEKYSALRSAVEKREAWTAQDSINYYRSLSTSLGREALVEDIESDVRNGGPGRSVLLREYDNSIRKLREAAGFEWGAVDAIEYYRSLSERLGHPANQTEIISNRGKGNPGYRKLVAPFEGSLSQLKDAAGYPTSGPKRDWSKLTETQAITLYREVSARFGRPATIDEINEIAKDGSIPNFGVFRGLFHGSIEELRERAGFQVEQRQDWSNLTKEQALAYYKTLSSELGKAATVSEVNGRSKVGTGPSAPTLLKYFDGKIEVLKAEAGFAVRQKREDWTPDRCIDYMVSLFTELGRMPTIDDIRRKSKAKEGPNINLLTSPFGGSFEELKVAARSRTQK